MVSEATIEAYKAMAKDSAYPSMEAQIRENLERTCEKFAGNEDKFERCMAFLNKVCMEMLGGADAAEDVQDENHKKLSGEIPDEVCFRICRDYFNDEIWKAEDEKKAEKEAKAKEAAQAKAEAEERAAKNEAKKKAAEEKKAAAAAKKAEIARKKAEAEREAKAEAESKKTEGTAKAETCPGQLDFLAMMGA